MRFTSGVEAEVDAEVELGGPWSEVWDSWGRVVREPNIDPNHVLLLDLEVEVELFDGAGGR